MFSQACKYAVRATLFLAAHADEHRKVGVKELATELRAPQPFLAKVLQQLTKGGIISSSKGPNGGFYLTDNNYHWSMMKIIECVDGEEIFNACVLGLPSCGSETPCPLHIQAFAYRQGLYYQLKHITIGEMAQRARHEKIRI
jgi:Rrf2 family protein